MGARFHRLKVFEVRDETAQTKSLELDVPSELEADFAWHPGQHLTLRLVLNGTELRRCFSISSSPLDGTRPRITVKRKPTGLVSGHIHTSIRAGDEIEVLPPSGGFCLDPDKHARRTCYFFAAGSGITPVFSMITALLAAEPRSVAHLLYGNRDEDDIIFRDALARLVELHDGRLSVCHLLSAPSFRSGFRPWRPGRIDRAAVEAFIAEKPPYAQDAQYLVCGPGAMNRDLRAALMAMDVPAERIRMESYGGDDAVAEDDTRGVAARARVHLAGVTREVQVAEGQTLLQAMRDAGLDPPYACEAGVCATCKASLLDGRVHLRSSLALDDGEIEAGDLLTCQALPLSDRLEVRFRDG